ncbi:MAG: riboflavin biosynthesis protein RibD, partial [Rhodospirillales bacterium 69-11]
MSAADIAHMRSALALARRGLGSTWPNPSVGCVIVRDGRVVGRGTTASGGRPHAEPLALDMAGPLARGATAYVTLEPCCHWGRTPPCTDALIAAGIVRVVVATRDPDRRVDSQGVARLREAGIEVVEGVLEAEAQAVLAGFTQRIRTGRPLVTLKLATTLDGRIATAGGESQWITGPPARRMAHALRGRHDAVMVGVGTVMADNPELTCRIAGFRTRPLVRVVADSHLRTRLTARLLASAADTPSWFLTRTGTDPVRIA